MVGGTARTNSAGTRASMASVLASRPAALAKWRARSGLMMATSNPAASRAIAAGSSRPPVDSTTARISAGMAAKVRRKSASRRWPAGVVEAGGPVHGQDADVDVRWKQIAMLRAKFVVR